MLSRLIPAAFAVALLSAGVSGQCANDFRNDKNDGILVTDFSITGTETLSASELAGMSGNFVGDCFSNDSDEMGERVRALFQARRKPPRGCGCNGSFPREQFTTTLISIGSSMTTRLYCPRELG